MVAVIVHEMVSIATKLITNFFYNTPNFFFIEVRTADLNALSVQERVDIETEYKKAVDNGKFMITNLPKSELFAKFIMITGANFENTGEREWMSTWNN